MPLIILILNWVRNLKSHSDEQLIEQYKKTQKLDYVGELFQRKGQLISSLSIKYMQNDLDAEDATYEIFEIISKDLLKHEVTNVNSWLFSVTRNHCYKKLKKQINEREKIEEKKKDDISFMEKYDNEDLLSKQAQESRFELMEECLSNLKEEHAKCLRLFYLERKSYKELEEITGYPLKKIKSYIQNGKRNLKIAMTERMNRED